jgi:hypothetical protein
MILFFLSAKLEASYNPLTNYMFEYLDFFWLLSGEIRIIICILPLEERRLCGRCLHKTMGPYYTGVLFGPAIQRDAELNYPLKELLGVIEEQLDIIEEDIAQLYDNWFIETCEPWVIQLR